MKTLNELLKKIGYNDTPLRKEVINIFREWLQQKLNNMSKGEFGEKTMILELLEELKK